MKIRKGRVITLTIALLIIFLVINYYPKHVGPGEVIDKVLENNLVKTFSQRFNEGYNITLITTDKLAELKNSEYYALYADLPDRSVYRVLVEEGGNGYLVFLDANTLQELKIIGAHNLVLT